MMVIIALLIVLGAVVGGIASLIALARIRELQRRITRLEEGILPATPPASVPSVQRPAQPAAPAAPAAPKTKQPKAKKRAGLEELLGSRLSVWLGAGAIILAGSYFVKYSVEQGLLGPGARMIIGALAGLALLVGGEWLRRRPKDAETLPDDVPGAVQGLSAAGLGVLYGVLLASTSLYHFLSPTVGFALLALVTAGAVVLALRQGPVVAIMGLLGGFATPVLVGEAAPDARGLFLYLLVLTIGVNTIAGRRGWPLVSILTVLFGNLWAGLWLVFSASPADVKWVALFLVGAAATLVATAARSSDPATRRAAWLLPGLTLRLIAFANIVLALALLGVALRQLGFNTLEWALLCLVALACVALERFDGRYGGLSWLAGAVLLAFLQLWHIEGLAGQTARFGLTALEAGLVFAAGGFACLARSRREGYWASLSAVGALAYFITAYAGLSGETSGLWALGAAGIGGLMAGAVMAVLREPARAAYGLAAALFVTIALSIGLSGAPRIIALAALSPVLAFIETRFFAPQIAGRWAGLRARRNEAISALRLLFLPLALWTGFLALDSLSGAPRPYNAWWLMAVLALPALAALAGAWQLRAHRAGRSAVVLEATFCVFAFLFFTLEVSPLLGASRGPLWTSDLVQIGFYPVIWLTLALVLWEARRWWPSPAFNRAAIVIGGLGVGYFALMPLLDANPLWNAASQIAGPKIFNALLWVYGAPAALFALAGWRLEGRGRAWAQSAALAVCFLAISLEVRHWFHGADLTGWRFGQAEQYAYSIVWMIFGAALLAPGIILGRPAMRYAALGVLALAVVKVFGFDTAHLEGLLRVASLLGLGLGLLALAYIYQRFVMTRTRAEE